MFFKKKFPMWLLVVFVTLFNFILVFLKVITRRIPTSYMDEIFHIPQAQRFCGNDFTKWDSKITTLPGLYMITIAIMKPLEWALSLQLCTVYGLRFINSLGTLVNFVLCFLIQQKITPKQDRSGFTDVISALNIASFPPLFFFTFMYYTDVWSTAFVLLMYNFHLSKSYFAAAVAGFCATLMRQTNIVWVGFALLDAAWLVWAKKDRNNITTFSAAWTVVRTRFSYARIRVTVWTIIPYVAVCSFFVAFVVVNGGIAVGDRAAHAAVLHPMQALYFLIIAVFFATPYIGFELIFMKSWLPHLPILCTIWLFIAIVSEHNFLEHPYLLSDNRHIAFYLWKRVFGNTIVRRLMTPVYVVAGTLLLQTIKRKDIVFLVTLPICIIANLTPQYLFELRYFIIPFIFLRLHFQRRFMSIFVEMIFYFNVNAFIFYVFVNKNILWESEPTVAQKLIW